MLVKIQNDQNLSRDLYSKAVINTNSNIYKSAKESKSKRLSMENRFESIDNEISSIRKDLTLILDILKDVR